MQKLLEQLSNHSLKSEVETPRNVLLKESYESILGYLTEIMDFETFIQLLPENGKMNFFLPFIQNCISKSMSKSLKETILNSISEMDKSKNVWNLQNFVNVSK